MKLFTKSKIAMLVPAALALMSGHAGAATANYSVGFSTVPEITMTQVTAMDMGTGIFMGAGSTCDLFVTNVSGTGYPGDVVMRVSRNASPAANVNAPPGADFKKLGQTAGKKDCVDAGTAVGAAGVYEISGIAGGIVNITIKSVTGTDFDFTPTGCASNYNNASDGDTCEDLVVNAPTQVTLASAADAAGNGGLGAPAVGKTYVALGGTLVTKIVHAAETAMTESMEIEVTY